MKGNLTNLKVIDVIRSLTSRTNRIGRLRLFDVTPDAPGGDIFIERGGIVGARIEPSLKGHYALYRLLDFDGYYEFVPGVFADSERNMEFMPASRVLEFDRSRKTVGATILSRIPDNDCRPQPNLAFDQALNHDWGKSPWRWRALMCIDGSRSITDIAKIAQMDELSICQLVVQLQNDGLVLPEVTLSDRYIANKVKLEPAPRKAGKKVTYSDIARRLLDQLDQERTLANVAERANVSYRDAARAVVDLFRSEAVLITAGEKDLSDLASGGR